ncbi:hypothetical protein QJS64_19525 (plasmid) [Paraclostridium bifermentans]|uniref:Uncharacterized protein n=1 Tax=Paraclostridium bifermentans TaxID=1490 RepID=A0ABY8R7F1_PARBF|nr:hypothetical protein QJS64_19525 [Paraclostridium bifermentans]
MPLDGHNTFCLFATTGDNVIQRFNFRTLTSKAGRVSRRQIRFAQFMEHDDRFVNGRRVDFFERFPPGCQFRIV